MCSNNVFMPVILPGSIISRPLAYSLVTFPFLFHSYLHDEAKSWQEAVSVATSGEEKFLKVLEEPEAVAQMKLGTTARLCYCLQKDYPQGREHLHLCGSRTLSRTHMISRLCVRTTANVSSYDRNQHGSYW